MKMTASVPWFLRWSLFILLVAMLCACGTPATTPEPAEQPSKAGLEAKGYADAGSFEVFFKGSQKLQTIYDGTQRVATETSGSYALEPGVGFVEGCAQVKGTEYAKEHQEPVLLITEMKAVECPPTSSP